MSDEHTILNHYNLSNPFPTSWPTEKDDSDSDEEKDKGLSRHYVRRSKSRYSALERRAHDRKSLVPGSEKLPHGQENLVQKDEPDPLGGQESVVRLLRKQGLPVEDDSRLRNRFLLSSTTFSPNLFLAQVHSQASTNELLQGLEALSRSIDSKSASLKVLVESNFERFVRAKTTIDNVYSEMRNQGAGPEQARSPGHSRVASRESRHFRNVSGQGSKGPGLGISKPATNGKKKNALTKESEYGVQGIRAPLIDVAVKAEEIWGPVLGGQEREGSLKEILGSVESCEEIFRVTKDLNDCMKRRDYDGLVEVYGKARKFADEARQMPDRANKNQQNLSDPQVNQLVITAQMWSDVEGRLEDFKRDVWRRLTNVQMSTQSSMSQTETEEHMPLIGVLLELGVDDNPIWVWLLSRYDYLKTKINATFERSRVEIEVLRRRLANGGPPQPAAVASHLMSCGGKEDEGKPKTLDTIPVLELWDLIYDSLNHLLSMRNGILAEVIEFWEKAQAFMDGKIQQTLPIGIDGRSRKHHRLSKDGCRDLQNGVGELIGMLQEYVFAFFADPPIDDVSLLYSPSADTPPPVTPLSPYARQDARFRFDENNLPPRSPKNGEAWEEFAFWPPYANSLSGAHYLEKVLTLLGSAAAEMAVMDAVTQKSHNLPEKLRMTVTGARERALKAACSAWGKDADVLKHLEDWSGMNEHPEMTSMPSRLNAFETTVLAGMQKILYIPEAANAKSSATGIISPPATKLIEMVRAQFLTSLYKALSGMVENAERPRPEGLGIVDGGMYSAEATVSKKSADDAAVHRDIRHLLTLGNIKALQSPIVPALVVQFETHFSLPITTESVQLRDALSQIHTRLFDSYVHPAKTHLHSLIDSGIGSPDWLPSTSRPSEVRPYIYSVLLHLVAIHAQVSTSTNPIGSTDPEKLALTNAILTCLFESLCKAFLAAFKKRQTYPLPALMQATLDVEFVAQTMSQYTSAEASKTQSEIYVELDRKTTREASGQLQGELPEMRKVLKGLREGTRGEFGCFRRVKAERGRGVEREG